MMIHIFTLLLFLLKLESHRVNLILYFKFQLKGGWKESTWPLTKMYKYFLHSQASSSEMAKIENDVLEKLSQQMEKNNEIREQSTTTKKILSGSDRKHSEFSFHPLIINSSKRQAARGQRRREKVPVREPRRVVVVLCARSFLAFIHTWTKN